MTFYFIIRFLSFSIFPVTKSLNAANGKESTTLKSNELTVCVCFFLFPATYTRFTFFRLLFCFSHHFLFLINRLMKCVIFISFQKLKFWFSFFFLDLMFLEKLTSVYCRIRFESFIVTHSLTIFRELKLCFVNFSQLNQTTFLYAKCMRKFLLFGIIKEEENMIVACQRS